MAIRKRLVAGLVTKLAASDTHFPNETTEKLEDSDSELVNNQSANTLYDPEDIEGGDTHYSIEASVKPKIKPKVKAAENINISQLPNDEDPTDGYLNDDEEEDELDVPNAQNNVVTGEDEEDDDAPDDEEWDPDPVLDEEEEDEIDEDGEAEDADEEDEEPDDEDTESMDILDVDETPEDEVDGMVFAQLGTKVMVIKANRIIAYMGRKQAVSAKVDDIYASTEFQDTVAEECRRHGLRAGLRSMGFSLASVDIAKSAVINARVDEKVKSVTAAVRRTYAQKDKSLNQCLAIASVGINRKYFKDVENKLASELIADLQNAGVRNAKQVVNAAFAQNGIEYAKTLVTLANKLSEMPEQTRNQFAEALDMVDDEGEFLESEAEDMDQEDDVPDFVDAEDEDGDFEDSTDDDFVPATVTAALAKPGKKTPALLRAKGVSVTAHSILTSDEPLIF